MNQYNIVYFLIFMIYCFLLVTGKIEKFEVDLDNWRQYSSEEKEKRYQLKIKKERKKREQSKKPPPKPLTKLESSQKKITDFWNQHRSELEKLKYNNNV